MTDYSVTAQYTPGSFIDTGGMVGVICIVYLCLAVSHTFSVLLPTGFVCVAVVRERSRFKHMLRKLLELLQGRIRSIMYNYTSIPNNTAHLFYCWYGLSSTLLTRYAPPQCRCLATKWSNISKSLNQACQGFGSKSMGVIL